MRVLLATFGSFGDVNPYIGLASALQKRGHEGVVAAPEAYREVVEREGLPFRPLRPDADLQDREALARVMDPKTGVFYLLEEVLLPALRESYDDLLAAVQDCDVFVSHTMVYAGPLVADATGLPWASGTLQPMAFMSPYDPPILSPMQELAWVRHLGRWPNAALFGLGRLAVKKWVRPIEELRRSLNLPLRKNPIYEGQFSPQLALALFSRELGAPQPDWPRSALQPGFVTYAGSHGPTTLSAELRDFLDAGEAPIVFTRGTSSVTSLDALFDEGLAAARQLGLRAIFVGDKHETLLGGHDALGSQFLHVGSAPFMPLFAEACLVVHPGGVGTVGISMLAGRPSLIVPVSADHPDNAARMVKLGVARTLRPKQCSAARLANELQQLRQPGWLQRAEALARRVRAEPGAAGACDALELLARGDHCRPAS